MREKLLIIQGSARSDGNTAESIRLFLEGANSQANVHVVTLCELGITPYDYEQKNLRDDFYDVTQKMFEADKIILATPVYWYAMSAHMKIFFDRLTDLLEERRDELPLLEGKTVYLLANGTTDLELPEGFEIPFERTCKYMNMNYGGGFFLYMGGQDHIKGKGLEELQTFREEVL